MNDFDKRFKAHRAEFDREFASAKRKAKLVAAIVIPLYFLGALLILGLLAVALYAALRYVGLI